MAATLEHGKTLQVIDADAASRGAIDGSESTDPLSAMTHKIDEVSRENRKEILTVVGKELASNVGSRVLLAMLAERRTSMREVARKSGFDVSLLSNIAKGKRTSGPELWTLIALADAMNFDLNLTFSER